MDAGIFKSGMGNIISGIPAENSEGSRAQNPGIWAVNDDKKVLRKAQ